MGIPRTRTDVVRLQGLPHSWTFTGRKREVKYRKQKKGKVRYSASPMVKAGVWLI